MNFLRMKDGSYRVRNIVGCKFCFGIDGSLGHCLKRIIDNEKFLGIKEIEHITLEGYNVVQPDRKAA